MAPPVSDPRSKPTFEDAIWYIAAVHGKFAAAELEKYEEILGVLGACNARSIHTEGVVARMEQLLSGHHDLLRSFNKFLPWSYIRTHGPAGGFH